MGGGGGGGRRRAERRAGDDCLTSTCSTAQRGTVRRTRRCASGFDAAGVCLGDRSQRPLGRVTEGGAMCYKTAQGTP